MRTRSSRKHSIFGGAFQCGCVLLVLALNLTVGIWSINYLLDTFVGARAATFPTILGAVLLGEITIPIAVFVWILESAGFI
jgi:hypothetical protein